MYMIKMAIANFIHRKNDSFCRNFYNIPPNRLLLQKILCKIECMKFVFCGYDSSLPALKALLNHGCELIAILTFPCDNITMKNTQMCDLASDMGVPITQNKPDQALIDSYIGAGAQLVLSVGYAYKLPKINEQKAYGINIHPSLLPKGRGVMPLPYIITQAPEIAGITAHKITPDIDAGDILLQRPIKLQATETIETLVARIEMQLPDMALEIVNNVSVLWKNGDAQNPQEATHFPPPTNEMRTIDFASSVAAITTLSRAFGKIGVLCTIQGKIWNARNLTGWVEHHNHQCGAVCHVTDDAMILAAKDGYICIADATLV